MKDTPRTNFVAHETGDAEWDRSINRFGRMMAHACILERENAAQLAELHRIDEALGTNEGHSSVTHIEILREKLKDCSAVVDMQQEQLDRNAEQLAALRLDAERYRWLRDDKRGRSLSVSSLEWTGSAELSDAAVDAAKEEGK